MKIDINKIKNLNFKLKLFICIIATIMCFICIKLLLNDWNNKIENYDYSKVYSVDGVIIDAYIKNHHLRENKKRWREAYIDVELETGEIITIDLGRTLNYSKGENIIIYTDGTNYSITEKGVAADAENVIINLLIGSAIGIFVIVIYGILFGWKGLAIGFVITIFFLIGQE